MERSFNSKKGFMHKRLAWKNWCSALCTTVALLAGSCRSINESTTIHRLDSLVWDRKVSATPEIIPPARAALSVPLDSLRKLPGGAAYTERSGQATVSLTFREGDVIASARCDSLERLVFELAEQLHSRGEQTEQKEEKKEAPVATFGQRLKWCSSGVLIGFILTVIIQFIYKLWQKRNKIYDRLA